MSFVGVTMLCRAPAPGRVKTRLARAIGPSAAACLHEAMSLDVLEALDRWSRTRGASLVLALTGSGEDAASFAARARRVAPGVRTEDQPEGDLGLRMARALTLRWQEGMKASAVVGSDCLGAVARLDQLLAGLPRDGVALVPARDGGFVALASACPVPDEWLSGLPWGGPDARAATVDALKRTGTPVRELWPDEDDVDDAPSLQRLRARLAARGGPAAPRVREWLRAEAGPGESP